MDAELLEVANHDPTRIHVVWEEPGVTPSLLERRQHAAVTLTVAFGEIDIAAFLFDQNLSIVDIAIDKNRGVGLIILDPVFERNGLLRVGDTKDLGKKLPPEILGILLLIATSSPVLHELLCCSPLLNDPHALTPRRK